MSRLSELIRQDNIFLKRNGDFLSKKEFIENVLRYRKYFFQKSYKRVALGIEDPYEFSCAFFALNSLEVTVVLLPNYQAGTLEQYGSEFDCFIDQGIRTKAFDLEEVILSKKASIELYTSGSQGKNKKILKQFQHLQLESDVLEEEFGELIGESTIFSSVSHQHIYGLLFRILWPLLRGRTISNFNIRFPEELSLISLSSGESTLVTSSSFLEQLGEAEIGSSKLKELFTSGGKLSQKAAANSELLFNKLPLEIYGSTETGGIATKKGSEPWRVFTGIKIKRDELGCLRVISPFIPEESFQTSDIIEIEKEGSFKLLGRRDRVHKISEKRISLDTLEEKLKAHPDIRDCYCLCLEKNDRIVIGCLLVWEEGLELKDIEKIKKLKIYLQQFFEPVLLPKKFRFVSEIEYDGQAKVSYQKVVSLLNE